MYFSVENRAIWQSYSRLPFSFPPSTLPIKFLQADEFSNTRTLGKRFLFTNRSDYFKIHSSSLIVFSIRSLGDRLPHLGREFFQGITSHTCGT